MKRLIFIFFMAFSLAANAQTDEFRKQYEDFKREAQKEYNDFRDKANAEYAEFIRQAWEKFQALPAIPKPNDEQVPPVVRPKEDDDKPIRDNELPFDDVVTIPQPEPQPVPPAPIREQPQPVEQYFTFTFFGTEGKVRLGDDMKFKLNGCTEDDIADGWNVLTNKKYDNLIRDCLELRVRHKLCDWAYLCMLERLTDSFFGGKSNEATLVLAYLYCQSGYKMRLAQADNTLYMLYASNHEIYDAKYFEINGEKFYPLNFNGERLFICEVEFVNEQPMSLLIADAQQFAWRGSDARTLTSERYKALSVNLACNKNLIDFYNTYPTSMIDNNFMTRWAMYANTPMETGVKETLYPQLRKHIAGLSKKEAVERLLNWVQTAFVYEYDDKVWGGDRAFFPEETLYYPYCDCEDRSILLTRLVRDLLGLKCILIYYPGHLASAVCFDGNVTGDYILLNGSRYTICDATYIGAPVGLTMPGMDNTTAKVILLD